jgi:hypothetical protein
VRVLALCCLIWRLLQHGACEHAPDIYTPVLAPLAAGLIEYDHGHEVTEGGAHFAPARCL